MRSVEECYQLAQDKGYQAFGLQGGHECWSSSDALLNYGKYGAGGTKCSTKGLGGHWALDVYMILGTFRRNSGAGSSGVSFSSHHSNLSPLFCTILLGGGGGRLSIRLNRLLRDTKLCNTYYYPRNMFFSLVSNYFLKWKVSSARYSPSRECACLYIIQYFLYTLHTWIYPNAMLFLHSHSINTVVIYLQVQKTKIAAATIFLSRICQDTCQRNITVSLRRKHPYRNSNVISTFTACGTTHYTIKDIYVLTNI